MNTNDNNRQANNPAGARAHMRSATIAVALCVLFVVACGSDNSKELTQPSPTAPATATTPAPPTATATTPAPPTATATTPPLPTATATPPATGSRIAFVSGSLYASNDEIYVMDADGSNQTNLTNNPASDWNPSWSPVQ